MKIIDSSTVVVPAGSYFLGDPCYCLEDGWSPLLDSIGYENGSLAKPVGTLPSGANVLIFHTAYGDGVYEGSDGFEYGVDSGCIGLVPVKAAEKKPGKYSKRITFKEPALCHSFNGCLDFGGKGSGGVCIDTNE